MKIHTNRFIFFFNFEKFLLIKRGCSPALSGLSIKIPIDWPISILSTVINPCSMDCDAEQGPIYNLELISFDLKPAKRDRIDVILANDIFKYQNLNPKMRKNQFQGWLYKVYDKFHNHLTKKERKCLVKKATEQER